MSKVKLQPHQVTAIKETKDKNRVAYYLDMGLGKTFVGSEKMKDLAAPYNLLICQKSKIEDWKEHFKTFYDYNIVDYTKPQKKPLEPRSVLIVNYETAWRRPELLKLKNYTLMLDESSYIKNERSKRGKFVLRLKPDNVVLLSGTPTGGKYEELYSQCRLLGWTITKKAFYENYIKTHMIDIGGFKMEKIVGYKNVNHLKRQLAKYGAVFMKSEDVLTLPEQVINLLSVKNTQQYNRFKKDKLITIDGVELVGNRTLTYMLYLRQLCGQYNENKLDKLTELLESTNDRVIIFYNFTSELDAIKSICKTLHKPVSVVNGAVNDLAAYNSENDSVTLVQYQAGAMGLNLQKANHLVYFTLPLSSELFEQSKKRIHRMGQSKTCFYYFLIVEQSIEQDILKTLESRQDYTEKLFEKRGGQRSV
ncbi:MAG: helicase, superfamily [Clostridia bacterium]|jgi:SNF2 family DNA or RNA helicase|nr:helicase, superfamily [Clostridia bacterium]